MGQDIKFHKPNQTNAVTSNNGVFAVRRLAEARGWNITQDKLGARKNRVLEGIVVDPTYVLNLAVVILFLSFRHSQPVQKNHLFILFFLKKMPFFPLFSKNLRNFFFLHICYSSFKYILVV